MNEPDDSVRGLPTPLGQRPSGSGSVEARLTVIETLLKEVATRADLSQMEVRMLKWGIGILISAVGLSIAIVNLS